MIVPNGLLVVGAAGGLPTPQVPVTVPVPSMWKAALAAHPAVMVICVGVPPPSVTIDIGDDGATLLPTPPEP